VIKQRTVYQDGQRVATGAPLKLNRFEASSPPDPAATLDCLLLLNDRTDGEPRTRVVVSNGASFDTLAYTTDAAQTIIAPQASAQYLAPSESRILIPATYNDTDLRRQVADLTRQLIDQNRRLTDLERVIDTLHQVAMDRIKERT
jgi:hypothetical protein